MIMLTNRYAIYPLYICKIIHKEKKKKKKKRKGGRALGGEGGGRKGSILLVIITHTFKSYYTVCL